MGTASIHEGVRRMRFSDLLDRTEAKELTQVAAAELLGINVRTFQRWAERYEAEGDDGLIDLRMGRRSPRRAPEEELERMLGLFRDKYAVAAQKKGGTLRLYHNDNPPSASLLEESTIASVTPFSAVFNNLVVFDPAKVHETLETVIPDLAESWSWDATNTRLTFKLRQGVTWHDGKPFTAKDVQCTWRMLIGKSEGQTDFRKNPRQVWYSKLQDVTTNGDYETTFVRGEPQPSLPVLLASGYSAVFPCHVPQQVMRTK